MFYLALGRPAVADNHQATDEVQLQKSGSGQSNHRSPPPAHGAITTTSNANDNGTRVGSKPAKIQNTEDLDWPAWIQAGSAIAMTFFTALLVWVSFRQEKISRTQSRVGERQLSLAALQTDLLTTQKEIARQGHLATHRPKLAVRNVVLQPHACTWPGQPMLITGEIAGGELYVVNRGGSAAWITNALVIIHHQAPPSLPMKPPYEGSAGNTGPMASPLLAGKAISVPIQSMQPVGQDKAVDILRSKSPDSLYVMGWVEYQDGTYDQETDSQLTRRTAFCRKFDASTRRFVRVKDDDYEYEE
jgi:hypothetical protein